MGDTRDFPAYSHVLHWLPAVARQETSEGWRFREWPITLISAMRDKQRSVGRAHDVPHILRISVFALQLWIKA